MMLVVWLVMAAVAFVWWAMWMAAVFVVRRGWGQDRSYQGHCEGDLGVGHIATLKVACQRLPDTEKY